MRGFLKNFKIGFLFFILIASCSSSDNGPSDTVDNSAPTQPTNLVASNITLASVIYHGLLQ